MTTRSEQRRTTLGTVLGVPIAAAAGWIGYSALAVPHDLPLPPAIDAEQRTLYGRAGQLNYYVAGTGRPLVLIHSINAAASAYEVGPIFEHYRHTRRVYALDLPGFGFSDRSAREYTPRVYTDAILDLLNEIVPDDGPVDALGLSLGSEFLARAASEQPEHFRTVALISPTGFGKREQYYRPIGSTRGSPVARRIFEFPVWSRPFYDLLTTKISIRYFLKQTFGAYDTIDEGLLEYDYVSAHQPDAQHAPFAFISGTLFSAGIDRIYEAVQVPVWFAYGPRIRFSDYGDLSNVRGRSNWTIQEFPTGGLPHFEQPATFLAAYAAFLAQATT